MVHDVRKYERKERRRPDNSANGFYAESRGFQIKK